MAADLVRLGGDPLVVELAPSLGGRIHRLTAFGVDLLRTPDDPRLHATDPVAWGGYVMAPWCNRLPTGPVAVEGRVVDLSPSFGDGTAIHGQVATRPWEVVGVGQLAIEAGGDAWPWRYRVTQRVAVDGARLSVDVELTNLDRDPMPAGLGLHPWLRRPVDVTVAADRALPSNKRPDEPLVLVAGSLDRRAGGLVPDGLDASLADLAAPTVLLHWPELRISGTLRWRAAVPTYLALATPPGVTDAVAIEPQTHLPGGLARRLDGREGGLALLAPGQSLELALDLELEPA